MQICLDRHTEFSLIQNPLTHLMSPVQDPLERTEDVWEETPIQVNIISNGILDYDILNIDTNLYITFLLSSSLVSPPNTLLTVSDFTIVQTIQTQGLWFILFRFVKYNFQSNYASLVTDLWFEPPPPIV